MFQILIIALILTWVLGQMACFPAVAKTIFLSWKFADTRSTKALRDSAEVHENQPNPATLGSHDHISKSKLNKL